MRTSRIVVIITPVLACALAGCPQTVFVAGADGGPAGDGGTTDASGLGGGDAGSDAGPADTDAGGDGGPTWRPFQWGVMTPASTSYFSAVHGSAPNNVYVAGRNGQIDRFNGVAWARIYHDSGNLDFRAVWVAPDDSVFAGGMAPLATCRAGCDTAANYVTSSTGRMEVTGLCGTSASNVYAVGNNTGTNWNGALWHYDGNTWSSLGTDYQHYSFAGCWVRGDGAVFIAAQSWIVRYQSAAFTQEAADYSGWTPSDIALQYFHAVWGSGSTVFAAGTNRRIVSRDGTGTWHFVFDANGKPTYPPDFRTLAGWTVGEVFAAGEFDTGRQFARFDGNNWSFAPDAATRVEIWGLWAAGADEYFAVGAPTGDVTGTILHGTR